MLGSAGLAVHLLDPGRTQASRSSWLSSRTAVSGGPVAVAERLVEMAPGYDRVILADEFLLLAVSGLDDPHATDILPAEPGTLHHIVDKTRFPSLARAAGLRVSPSWRAVSEDELNAAFDRTGGTAVIKGAVGAGGAAVREARDVTAARASARELGYPVLVEAWIDGRVCLLPCLFERGRLVAAIAAEKRMTVRRFGPSSVNAFIPVDRNLLAVARCAGESFGMHGFASIDLVYPSDGSEPVVLEINPRPVPQLHLDQASGVNMAEALKQVLEGRFGGEPTLGQRFATAVMFPQELTRNRLQHGAMAGFARWVSTPGAFEDMPWDDRPLLVRQLLR